MFAELKTKINIKYFMVGYLTLLAAFSCFIFGKPLWFVKGLALVAVYSLLDLAWTKLKGGAPYLPTSSWISGLIIFLLIRPDPPIFLIVLLPLVAVLTKHLLHFGKARHLFNPAASALFAVALFGQPTIWWGMSWGWIPLIIVTLVGLFILWRQGRFETSLAFIAAYLVFETIVYTVGVINGGGMSFALLPVTLLTLLAYGGNIFFATVMLIEPVTSNYPGRRARLVYGALTALFVVLAEVLAAMTGYANFDPVIVGLLLGNLVAGLLYLPAVKKTAV